MNGKVCHKTVLVALRGAHGFAPAPRRSLALLDSAEHFAIEMLCKVARGGTEAATPEQPQSTCGVKLRLQA